MTKNEAQKVKNSILSLQEALSATFSEKASEMLKTEIFTNFA